MFAGGQSCSKAEGAAEDDVDGAVGEEVVADGGGMGAAWKGIRVTGGARGNQEVEVGEGTEEVELWALARGKVDSSNWTWREIKSLFDERSRHL